MRHRLEDLGRLYEKLMAMKESKFFEEIDKFSKHYEISEWFETIDEDKRNDFLHDLRFWVVALQDDVYECLAIASANDDLNTQD